jgi:HPt (histidine-containing phosphotransfer) domain-containing protein
MANAIDKSVFENLKVMTGADFIGELIDTFLSDSVQQIAMMQSALKTRDFEGFRRAAHSLKSTAASFGAGRLSSLALELEGIARANNLEVGTRLDDLQSAFEQAAEELKGLRT